MCLTIANKYNALIQINSKTHFSNGQGLNIKPYLNLSKNVYTVIMKMNLGHIKTFPGILKIAGIIIGLIAASLGASAFVTSPYNKSCGNSEPFLPVPEHEQITVPGTDLTDGTTLRTRPPPLANSKNEILETTINTLEETTIEDEVKDMAPVLWMERFQISITWISVIVSAVLLLLYILVDSLQFNHTFKGINFLFHFVGCILLIVSAIFMTFATYEIDRKICRDNFDNKEDCQSFNQKLGAAAFSLLQAVIYAILSIKILGTKLYEEV